MCALPFLSGLLVGGPVCVALLGFPRIGGFEFRFCGFNFVPSFVFGIYDGSLRFIEGFLDAFFVLSFFSVFFGGGCDGFCVDWGWKRECTAVSLFTGMAIEQPVQSYSIGQI